MKFVESPFCIKDNLSVCLIDGRVSDEIEKNLNDMGIEVIKTPKCEDVYEAISYHPDIQFFNCGEGKIIVAPNLYEKYEKIIDKIYYKTKNKNLEKIKIIKGEKNIEKKYPNDIPYNVCVVGKYAIHNFEYTDGEVLKFIEEKNLKKIDIKQGYAKCSICVVDEKSIITSDKGIAEKIKNSDADIECLLINEGNIDLFEMNYGFIGGCSGLLSQKEIGFLGKIENHPNFERIKKFLDERNIKIVSLSNKKLIDLGSIIPIICSE